MAGCEGRKAPVSVPEVEVVSEDISLPFLVWLKGGKGLFDDAATARVEIPAIGSIQALCFRLLSAALAAGKLSFYLHRPCRWLGECGTLEERSTPEGLRRFR